MTLSFPNVVFAPVLRWAATCVLAVLLASPAFGQGVSADELRREIDRLLRQNQALSAQVADQTRRLDALAAENKKLQDELQATRARPAMPSVVSPQVPTVPDAPMPPPELRAPVPADPLASPASMLAELSKRYEAELATMSVATPRDQAEYEKLAKRWCDLTSDRMRGSRQWLMTFRDWRDADPKASPAAPSPTISVLCRVIDEASGLPIGEPFRREMSVSYLDRFERQARLFAEGKAPEPRWMVSVMPIAKPVFNAERLEPGPYNEPPFIGRQIEFTYDIDWRGMTLWKPDQPSTTPAPASPVKAPNSDTRAPSPR